MVSYNDSPHKLLYLEEFFLILRTLNRHRELVRLVRWTCQRKLSGPLKAYESKLKWEEIRLAYYTIRSPLATACARIIHTLTYLTFPEPKYMQKGSAAAYRTSVG
jgi:hypothetical protein